MTCDISLNCIQLRAQHMFILECRYVEEKLTTTYKKHCNLSYGLPILL